VSKIIFLSWRVLTDQLRRCMMQRKSCCICCVKNCRMRKSLQLIRLVYNRPCYWYNSRSFILRIIIGSDRRPETKQGIEGKIDRFRSGMVRVRDRVRVRYNWSPIWTYTVLTLILFVVLFSVKNVHRRTRDTRSDENEPLVHAFVVTNCVRQKLLEYHNQLTIIFTQKIIAQHY